MYTWVSVCRYVFVCVMSMSVWLLRQEAPIDIEQVAHCGHFLAVFCLFFVFVLFFISVLVFQLFIYINVKIIKQRNAFKKL